MDKVQRRENPKKPGLDEQQKRIVKRRPDVARRGYRKCDHQRREQQHRQGEAIDPQVIFNPQRRQPGRALLKLHSSRRVELRPQERGHRQCRAGKPSAMPRASLAPRLPATRIANPPARGITVRIVSIGAALICTPITPAGTAPPPRFQSRANSVEAVHPASGKKCARSHALFHTRGQNRH